MNRAFRLVALTLSLAALPAAAAWKVTDLGRPDDATFQIRIAAINDKGEIAGGVWRHGTLGSGPRLERAPACRKVALSRLHL